MTQNDKNDNKINTISDEVDAQANQLNSQSPQRHVPSTSSSSARHQSSNSNSSTSRWSFKRQSTRKTQSTENESITLQESEQRPAPLQLKASFLRRKIKEYEGNRKKRSNHFKFSFYSLARCAWWLHEKKSHLTHLSSTFILFWVPLSFYLQQLCSNLWKYNIDKKIELPYKQPRELGECYMSEWVRAHLIHTWILVLQEKERERVRFIWIESEQCAPHMFIWIRSLVLKYQLLCVYLLVSNAHTFLFAGQVGLSLAKYITAAPLAHFHIHYSLITTSKLTSMCVPAYFLTVCGSLNHFHCSKKIFCIV